jgi:hypothetical protein
MGRPLGTSTRTRLNLPSRNAYRWGEDEIKKLVIDYKEGRIENALKKEQPNE